MISYSAYMAVEDFKEQVLSKTPISTQVAFSMTEPDSIKAITKALEKIGIPC